MLRFLLFRSARAFLTVLICVTGVFVVLRIAGDPAAIMLPPETPPDIVDIYRHDWGLDRPLPEQYVQYLANAARGDFGRSLADDRPALQAVADAVPKSALLGACALLLAILIGTGFGITAALNHNTMIDRLAMGTAVLGYSVPVFFLGILMILAFALKLRVLPAAGSDTWAHLLMPALTLSLPMAGKLARFVRTAMLEVMTKPFVLAARAKGVKTARLVVNHILPNAAVPLLMFLGIEIGNIMAQAAVVETIFAWPGLGRLVIDSVSTRDLPVVQASIITVTLIMVAANLLTDILHVLLDPRLGGFAGANGSAAS